MTPLDGPGPRPPRAGPRVTDRCRVASRRWVHSPVGVASETTASYACSYPHSYPGWWCSVCGWQQTVSRGAVGTPRAFRLIRCEERASSDVSGREDGSPGWTRTNDQRINSPLLYRLSYRGTGSCGRARIVGQAPRGRQEKGRSKPAFSCWIPPVVVTRRARGRCAAAPLPASPGCTRTRYACGRVRRNPNPARRPRWHQR